MYEYLHGKLFNMNIEVLKEDENTRVDTYLTNVFKDIEDISLTRSLVQRYVEKGCLINGKECKKSYRLKEGDVLNIDIKYWVDISKQLDLSKGIKPQKGNLDIRYEDENMVVLFKPKGLVVHPGVGNTENTLANHFREYLESKGEYDTLLDRCGIVHRLDKGVSGLMVVAKNKRSQEYLKSLFQSKEVVKIYMASLEEGKESKDIYEYLSNLNIEDEPWKEWERVEGYIGRSSKGRYSMEFKGYEFGGSKYALSYFKFFGNRVLVKIDTGRMHQIRATLKYLGYHIKGDSLYGLSKGKGDGILLESVLLSFIDMNGKRLTFRV